MKFPDTSTPVIPQEQTPPKRIHTAITFSPEVLARIDSECDARKGEYVYNRSRSTVIENYIRRVWGWKEIPYGRKKIRISVKVSGRSAKDLLKSEKISAAAVGVVNDKEAIKNSIEDNPLLWMQINSLITEESQKEDSIKSELAK